MSTQLGGTIRGCSSTRLESWPTDSATYRFNGVAGTAHESPRTTKLYDRTADDISLDEIEGIVI